MPVCMIANVCTKSACLCCFLSFVANLMKKCLEIRLITKKMLTSRSLQCCTVAALGYLT